MQITEVEYASYLSYTPRPQSEEQRSSKDVTLMLKNNEMWRGTLLSASEHIIRQMAKKVDRLPFYDFFRNKPVLVPMPSSSLKKYDSLWVPRRVSLALVRNGLGSGVIECLKRIRAVPKSSRSLPEKRPKATDHYDSLGVETIHEAGELLIIDDVITRGANMMGAVNRPGYRVSPCQDPWICGDKNRKQTRGVRGHRGSPNRTRKARGKR